MRVAICVPHYGDVKAEFAQSLARLIAYSLTTKAAGPQGQVKFDIAPFFAKSSLLVAARTRCVVDALKWGANWLLLVDSDQVFPPDALFRIMLHGKPVVGCNYQMRSNTGPVIPRGSGLEEVDHLGLGFFLIHRSAIEAIASKGNGFPLFMVALNETGDGFIGEDVFFCRKLKSAGFPVFCDHDLSREIGHVADFVLELGSADRKG